MVIENRNLPVGTRLVASYKKQAFVCTVEAGEEEGALAFVLEDGQRFKSPSAAGSKVMGGGAVNGWRFWSVEGTEPARTEKAEKPAKAPKATKAPKAPKSKSPGSRRSKSTATVYAMPSQEGVAEGHIRIFCRACMNGYIVEGTDLPDTCPEGHSNSDPELNAPSGLTAGQEAEVSA
jgi:hypothetical protein